MISNININQPIDLSSLNNITITENTGNKKDSDHTIYTGNNILNNAIISPGGRLSITNNVVANKTIAKSTTDNESGKGAYFYVTGNAKSNNATIGENAYLNVGDVRKQEYKNGHWIFKPLSDQLTKNKAYAIKTHLLKGGVLWTGINSITKNTINNGGILNEYYGSVSGSINTNRGSEYTFSPVISSNSTFNHSYDYVGLTDKKGGIQNNVSAEKNSVINATNDGTINNIKSIDSTIISSDKGTINNIDSQHSIINIKNGGIASHITATKNSIINNENIIKNSNILTNSTLNMDTKSKADTVILNNSLINVNGTSTISNIISNNDSNTISFTKKAPITLNSNTITGNYTVNMSSNLDTFSTDLINVKHQIKVI